MSTRLVLMVPHSPCIGGRSAAFARNCGGLGYQMDTSCEAKGHVANKGTLLVKQGGDFSCWD